MVSKLRALVTDLDMTLIDSRRDISIAMAGALSAIGGKTVTEKEISEVIGQGLPVLFARFAPDAPYPSPKFWEGVKHYQALYKPNCNIHTTLYPGVLKTLQALRERGIKMAVASNKWGLMARHVCGMNEIESFFSHFQGIEETPGKPKPDLVLKCCKALDVSPKQTLYVGDKTIDVQAGKAAGCFTAAVTYGLDDAEALRKEDPDLLVDRFEELLSLF